MIGGGGGLRRGLELLLLLRRGDAAAPSKPYLRSTVTRTARSPPFSRSSNYSSTPSSSSTTTTATTSRNGLVVWYLAMIESRPVLTKSLTAGAIFTAADASSQMITRAPNDSLDLIRTMRMASYGMLISGPSLHLWFNFVSKVLPKRDVVTTFMKMFLGQTVYGPIVTSVFFSYNAALQGETFPEIIARLKRDLIPTFKSGLVYWPVCDFITFKFIPVRLQVNHLTTAQGFSFCIMVVLLKGLIYSTVKCPSADPAAAEVETNFFGSLKSFLADPAAAEAQASFLKKKLRGRPKKKKTIFVRWQIYRICGSFKVELLLAGILSPFQALCRYKASMFFVW